MSHCGLKKDEISEKKGLLQRSQSDAEKRIKSIEQFKYDGYKNFRFIR